VSLNLFPTAPFAFCEWHLFQGKEVPAEVNHRGDEVCLSCYHRVKREVKGVYRDLG
jgi:hypothetical protein